MDRGEVAWAEVRRQVTEAGLDQRVEWLRALDVEGTLSWFAEWWDSVEPSDLQRRVMLLVVWGGTLNPHVHLQIDLWVERFRRVGFISDAPGQDPPTSDLAVFRGAPRGSEGGMSWTTSARIAGLFAKKYTEYEDAPGLVWSATISPGAVLALIDQREEEEVVVDPAGLRNLELLT